MSSETDLPVPAPASAGEIGKLISEFNVVSYRLEAMEKRLDTSLDLLAKKLDELIDRHNETKEKQALAAQALQNANDEIEKLEGRVKHLEKDVVTVRISMAERFAYGGLGGGAVAGLFEVAKMFIGG